MAAKTNSRANILLSSTALPMVWVWAGLCLLAAVAIVGLMRIDVAGAQEAQQIEPPNGLVVELPIGPDPQTKAFSSAIDPDGNPVLGRADSGSSQVRTCLDRQCQDIALVEVDLRIHEMMIDAAGDLLLFGESVSRNAVVFVRCARVDDAAGYCADSQERSELPESSGGKVKDVVLDADGLAVVLWSSFPTLPTGLHVVRCADPGCLQVASQVQIADGTGVGDAALALDSAGRPFVAFVRSVSVLAGTPLSIVSCGDEACTTRSRQDLTPASLDLPDDLCASWALRGLATPGTSPRPVIVLQNVRYGCSGPYLVLVDCGDFECPAPTTSVLGLRDTAVAAVELEASFVGTTPSNELFIYGNGVMAVCPDARCEVGVSTRLIGPVYAYENPRPTVAFEDSGRFVARGTDEFVTVCESVDCRVAPTSQVLIHGRCVDGGRYSEITATVNNLSSEPVHVRVSSGQTGRGIMRAPEQTTLLDGGPAAQLRLAGRPEGPAAVVVSIDGVVVASEVIGFACKQEPATRARASCLGGAGRVDVMVVGDPDRVPTTYRVRLGDAERLVTIDESDSVGNGSEFPNRFAGSVDEIVTFTRRPDGVLPVEVVDVASGATIYDSAVTVRCNPDEVTSASVTFALSCLGGNGRIDTTIMERSASEATWRVQVGSLSPRVRTVAALDWWRSPITGRPDGPIDVDVFRNDVHFAQKSLNVACDGDAPVVSSDEVVAISACRGGLGYVLFQFVNATAAPKSWVIAFAGVPNRSTTAAPYGASVRAVTGRPGGTYDVTINGIPRQPVVVSC